MSLRDYLMSPQASQDKLSELKMRTGPKEVAVMVEGSTDWRVYQEWLRLPPGKKFIGEEEVFGHLRGRDRVLRLVEHCQEVGRPYLAFVDSDDACPQRQPSPIDGVIYTDYRDLEATMFLSGRSDRVLNKMFGARLHVLATKHGLSSVEWVLRQCAFTGAARMLRLRWSERVRFPSSVVSDATNPQTFELDRGIYARSLARANSRLGKKAEAFRDDAEDIYRKFDDEAALGLLLHGHDLITYLVACSLNERTGENRHTSDSVQQMLWMGFDLREANTTRMWADIERWQGRKGVRLLSDVKSSSVI